jgi:hypothetical protein
VVTAVSALVNFGVVLANAIVGHLATAGWNALLMVVWLWVAASILALLRGGTQPPRYYLYWPSRTR